MASFYHFEHAQASQRPATERRLPVGQSIAVIAGLSVLSWVVLISVIVAIRALLPGLF